MLNRHNAKNGAVSEEHAQFLRQIKRENIKVTLLRVGILAAVLALWEIGAELRWIDPFIMSSPSRIIRTIGSLMSSGELLTHVGVTVWETVMGFALGTVLGIGIAILLWWSPTVQRTLDPYLVVLNSLPKIALGPVIIVWVGAGQAAIITMALLISVIVTVMSVLTGFMEVSDEKLLLMRTFGATKLQMLRMVILPGSVPSIISTIKINVGMTWVGVIVGEYLVSKAGLGYLIVYGGQVFKLDLVMASILILSVIAVLMYLAVAWVEKRYSRNR
ncbi:MAG: ABC transporter permease [Christensenellales bacterium]|jgi:NitT/TauT family transport system permease protein